MSNTLQRCLLVIMNSNLELTLWCAPRNHLKEAWTKVRTNPLSYFHSDQPFIAPQNEVIRFRISLLPWKYFRVHKAKKGCHKTKINYSKLFCLKQQVCIKLIVFNISNYFGVLIPQGRYMLVFSVRFWCRPKPFNRWISACDRKSRWSHHFDEV